MARISDEQWARMRAQINECVADRNTDELFGMVVSQVVERRYFGGDTSRLEAIVAEAVSKRIQQLIADWISENDDNLWAAVLDRLEDVHVKDLASAITDEFMEDLRKGKR